MAPARLGAEWPCRPELIGKSHQRSPSSALPRGQENTPHRGEGRARLPFFPGVPIGSLYKEAVGRGQLVFQRPQACLVKG